MLYMYSTRPPRGLQGPILAPDTPFDPEDTVAVQHILRHFFSDLAEVGTVAVKHFSGLVSIAGTKVVLTVITPSTPSPNILLQSP